MDEPVFVIHGVGNRDSAGFTATVATLRDAAGVDMVPVFWGDLGADDRYVELALPSPGPAESTADVLLTALADDEPGGTGDGLRQAGPELPEAVRTAVRERMDGGGEDDGLRSAPGGFGRPGTGQVLDALAEEWPGTRWLSLVDDPGLLRETGTAVAEAVTDADPDDSAAWDGLRGPAPDAGNRLRALVARRLADLDRVAGAAMQAVAGRVNRSLRGRYGPGTTRFLGDVLVYQRHREEIHARVRERIEAVDPSLGRAPDRPVRIVAHSLGGVIAVDMATAHDPLWTSDLLTFGSQAAYFHLCDPRGGALSPYTGEGPVSLPPSLGRWTNLWQPLDVLAFAASRVFRLADGTRPVDIPVAHTVSAGLWTHSAYWDLPAVASAIGDALRPGDTSR